MIDQVYCISLHDSERWHAVERCVASRGLNLRFQRFLAVDTREDKWEAFADELSPRARAELQECIAQERRTRNAQLTPGAVGCYLSHLGVYHTALSRGHECILVLEDDAELCENFRSRLREQVEALPEWDVLVLGYEAKRVERTERRERNAAERGATSARAQPKCVRLRKFYGAYAYVITRRGMQKILDRAWPIQEQFDSALSSWSDTLKIFAATPKLATHVWQGTSVQSLPMKFDLNAMK